MITDFHTHVLPCVDDGSKSVEQSIQMLQKQAEQGIKRVVATPHFYPLHDTPEQFLERRGESAKQLQEAMAQHAGLPTLLMGAEVYYYRGISDSEYLPQLCIENTNSVLIEMPFSDWTEQMYEDLEGIYEKQGLIPIIAHLDRYITPLQKGKVLNRLMQLPVLIQVNAESFQPYFMRRLMLRLIQDGMVHLIGSDCHNLDKRPPDLSKAVALIEKHLGKDSLSFIESCENRLFHTATTI